MKIKMSSGKPETTAVTIHHNRQGFTIVELLIVFVVIAVLVTLVVTTFNGVQQRSRNKDREKDLAVLKSQLESYHIQRGYYPSLANINDTKWLQDNMKSLDTGVLQPPGSDEQKLGQTATKDQYGYNVTPVGCNNAEDGQDCTAYTLSALLEGTDEPAEEKSLNQ